jgi:gamma-glutamylcyclotransferase (GGCT)/AIG2-like uncharacterized protein YtfP
MRAAEFMRTLADLIDQLENKTDDVKSTEVETPMDSGDVMVPPLQQKIEYMKKMADGKPSNALDFNSITAEEDEPFEG